MCHVAEGFCATAAGLPEASRFPARRMIMDEVAWHREPPSNISTMVTAFGGWIDAGEAATGAMLFLVRQLAAEPLAEIDPEDFVDFTQVRPVVRLSGAGERTIRWPRSALWLWQPSTGDAGLLLFRGLEPQRRWRAYATALLDVAARCGVQQIVSLGAVLAGMPHTRPSRVTGNSTDPAWQARFEACGILTRRSRYEGPTGMATISWTRRGAAAWRRATYGGTRPIICRGPRIRRGARHCWPRSPACSTWNSICPPLRRPCRPFGANVTRLSRKTPPSRPMSGNWSRTMTRQVKRHRTPGVRTTLTQSN